MGKKKIGFTLKQHDQLGLEIQTMRDRLVTIGADLTNHYRQKDKVAGLAKTLSVQLEKLRSQLDNLVFKEQTGNKEINPIEIYYRATRNDHVRNPQPIRPFPQE